MGNTEDWDVRGDGASHSRAVTGSGDGMVGGGEQNRPPTTLVCDVPGDGEMRPVAINGWPIKIETACGVAGFILSLMGPEMRDFVIRINVTHDLLQLWD